MSTMLPIGSVQTAVRSSGEAFESRGYWIQSIDSIDVFCGLCGLARPLQSSIRHPMEQPRCSPDPLENAMTAATATCPSTVKTYLKPIDRNGLMAFAEKLSLIHI